jgi:Uma2 family endonuclease
VAAINDFSQLDPDGVYSYADYLTWKFDQALEIIKCKIFKMAAPSSMHQRLSRKLTLALGNHFENHRCELFAAPFDVRLFDKKKLLKANKDIFTNIQPDICIICDLKKIDKNGCLGAPNLMVEILSPGNSKCETKIKKELYAESGVREYWIVDPEHETVTRFNFNEECSTTSTDIFSSDDIMSFIIFPDFTLNVSELFPETEQEQCTNLCLLLK